MTSGDTLCALLAILNLYYPLVILNTRILLVETLNATTKRKVKTVSKVAPKVAPKIPSLIAKIATQNRRLNTALQFLFCYNLWLPNADG